MATMISEVYDALKEAGASEEKSQKAAEALASYDNHFAKIENHLTALRGENAPMRWMLSFNLAFTVAILWKVFAA